MLRHKSLRILLGIIFLILAIVGSLVPIMQGWMFLALAFVVLSPDVPLFRKWLFAIKQKYPKLQEPMRRVEKWMEKFGLKIDHSEDGQEKQ